MNIIHNFTLVIFPYHLVQEDCNVSGKSYQKGANLLWFYRVVFPLSKVLEGKYLFFMVVVKSEGFKSTFFRRYQSTTIKKPLKLDEERSPNVGYN